jgi:hypothetical protein
MTNLPTSETDRRNLMDERIRKGVVPVRKPDLLPTDKNALSQEIITPDALAPCIEYNVWKSKNWRSFSLWFPWTTGSFFVFVGTVILYNPSDMRYSPLFFFIACALFLTAIPLKRMGKTIVRLGFDWHHNAFWMKRASSSKTIWEADANLILGFNFIPYELSPSGVFFTGSAYFPVMRGDTVYVLTYKRSGSPHPWILADFTFATSSECREICQKLNQLLETQN